MTRQALFEALEEEALLRPEVLERVLTFSPQADSPARASPPLTKRGLEVLSGVAPGERSKEIASRLGISERTVKAHPASIYNKLGVDTCAAAIAVALQRGWLR